MMLNSAPTIGVWSDLHSCAIRDAIQTLGMEALPVVYLDGDEVPVRYKLRHVPGDPVPVAVRIVMENSVEPWTARDRALKARVAR